MLRTISSLGRSCPDLKGTGWGRKAFVFNYAMSEAIGRDKKHQHEVDSGSRALLGIGCIGDILDQTDFEAFNLDFVSVVAFESVVQ